MLNLSTRYPIDTSVVVRSLGISELTVQLLIQRGTFDEADYLDVLEDYEQCSLCGEYLTDPDAISQDMDGYPICMDCDEELYTCSDCGHDIRDGGEHQVDFGYGLYKCYPGQDRPRSRHNL